MTNVVWFRNDLRVSDNPALAAACKLGAVRAVFCWSIDQWREHDVGDARVAFVLRCVRSLAGNLSTLGIPLTLIEAPHFTDVPTALQSYLQKEGATRLFFNAEYPLNEKRRDAAVLRVCDGIGVDVEVHHGSVLSAPGSIRTGAGKPYTVFTPFKRRFLSTVDPASMEPIRKPRAVGEEFAPLPTPDTLDGVRIDAGEDLWPGGERAGKAALKRFTERGLTRYAEDRDFPSLDITSRLGAHLSVGTVSPRQCVQALKRTQLVSESVWMNELIWREFYRHVIDAFPRVSKGRAFKVETDSIRWEQNEEHLQRWQAGETGYPLVDAGMRQLNATGWMHNRLRMVTAMFLSKHLLLDWRLGESYFMNKLVDGDFASNNGGWQWSASTGTDAAPYFRIFSPMSQGKRFDAKGLFTRQWIPELADVSDRYLFEPWREAPSDYPAPVVEHAFARQRAIDRFS